MIGFLCKIVQICRTDDIIKDKAQMKTLPLRKTCCRRWDVQVVGNIAIAEILFEACFDMSVYNWNCTMKKAVVQINVNLVSIVFCFKKNECIKIYNF